MDFFGDFVYYFIENSIEIIKVVIIFITFFGMKVTFTRKNIFLSCITLVIFAILWTLEKNKCILLLFYISFFTIEIYILFSEFEFKKILLKEIWIILFINIIDAMVYNAFASICEYFGFRNVIIIRILAYIFVLLFLIFIKFFIYEKVRFLHKISSIYYIIYLLTGVADYFLLTYVFTIMLEMNKKALIVSVIVSVSILLQYSLVLLITIANEGLKFQQHLNQKYLHVQQENYEYLEYREEETKKFRHDYKNHLNSLQILCQEKRYNDVEKYIGQISERLNVNSIYISVGNSFVDAILNYYYQKMDKFNVKFIVSGKMPKVCNIVMFDICTIISNLLDNALEAVEKLDGKDKWIEIVFRYDDLMVYCNVINPYNGKLNISKNKILSIKNTKNHGYGLANVKKSVEIYNGSIDIKTEDGLFKVLIALINKDKASL